MAKYSIENRLIWLDGNIVSVNDAKINVLSPTSQFGLNVFEGIRCYWNNEQNQLYAFRLDDHFRRLKRSQKLLMIEDKYTIDDMKNALISTVRANDYREDIAVRQTIFIEGFGSWSSTETAGMFVSPIPKGKSNAEYNKRGLDCCVSSWRRIDDNVMSPRIKCGANYINSRMAQLEAIRNGYDTSIFLNSDGKVAEGPGSCLFIVRDGVLITPMLTESVLESITRDTIIRIAEMDGITVEERTIDRTELYMCDEAFLCGSAMEITPINSVDKYKINNGFQGDITKKMHIDYLNIVYGRCNNKYNWLTQIYD
jgi:branched-chain amino acid aminotransferase